MPDEDELSLPPGGIPNDDPVWQPWEPATLAKLLDGVAAPWYHADLAGVLPLLEPSDRSWLAAALQADPPRA